MEEKLTENKELIKKLNIVLKGILMIDIAIILTLFVFMLIIIFFNNVIYSNQIFRIVLNLFTIFAIFTEIFSLLFALLFMGPLFKKTEELTNQTE